MKLAWSYLALTSLAVPRSQAFVNPVSISSLLSASSSSQSTNQHLEQNKSQLLFNVVRGGGRRKRKQSNRLTQKHASATTSVNGDNDEFEANQVKNKLTKEFFTIALPAFVQLAAEPLASLVDTAYLGRLGPEVLGGAGVAISAQYAVSKLYNDPLLRTSISLVASQDGKTRSSNQSGDLNDEQMEEKAKKELSVAVSSGLLLALSVGLIQLVVYTLLANGIIQGMG